MPLITPEVDGWKGSPIAAGGGPPDNGQMEHRLTALETRLDTILPTLATKADLADVRTDIHRAESSLTKWGIGLAVAIVGALIGYLSLTKPPPQQPQPQPIVIQLPPQPTQPAPPTPATPPAKQ